MNAAPSSPAVWSRNRWVTVVSALGLAHTALVLGLTRWPRLPVQPDPPTAPVQWVNGSDAGLADLLLRLPDPLLFIRDDERGFYGSAARAIPRNEYAVAEFKETPRWLAADAVARPAGEAPGGVMPVVKWPREPDPVLLGEDRPLPLLEPTSQVTVRGGLVGRRLLEPLHPPVWKSAEILPATVVEAGVTGAGDVLIARLVSTSGLPAADDAALALARQARFISLAGDRRDPGLSAGELAWGEIAFTWRTEP